MKIVRSVREFFSHVRFLFPLKKIKIEELESDFSSEVIEYIRSYLGNGSKYFEFGAGASTIICKKMGAEIFSTETDQRYIEAFKGVNHVQFVNPLGGKIGPWGTLIFQPWRKKERISGFNYATMIWQKFSKLQPNLVLIDGRYRLACALEIIRRFPGHNFPVIIDDYVGRSEYKTLEKYVNEVTQISRAGVFSPNKADINMEELRLDLEKAYFDSR
jgi:hypothetical protein